MQRNGSKVRGVGVGISSYSGGSVGFDGLFIIKPDGTMRVHTGIGNLGTESFSDCQRVAAEMVGVPWEKVEIVWGDTSLHLPWSCNSGGSQTIHAHTRASHAAATDAITKLQQIAAKDLGGKPEDYEVGGERVYRKGGGRGMTLAQAAKRAIELGGIYDGHELPKDINAMTTRSATALAGQGLMGVAKDNYKRDGTTRSFSAAFAEVEVDIETGKYTVTEFLSVADVGTVIHPTALGGQVLGRSISRHRSCDWSPVDLRPAVRSGAREAVLQQQPSDDSRYTAEHRVGFRRPARSGNAGRRARHRRTPGSVRLQCGAERDFRRARRRGVCPLAGYVGSHRQSARHQEAGAVPAHGQRVGRSASVRWHKG